jgi:hypothetical protein
MRPVSGALSVTRVPASTSAPQWQHLEADACLVEYMP